MQNNTMEERFDKTFPIPKPAFIGETKIRVDMKKFIQDEIHLAEQSLVQRVLMEMLDEMQKRANNIPPNLLLNELVNYVYDTIKLSTPKPKGDK